MNLLIVDDDMYAIKAVCHMIQDIRPRFDQVYTALNIMEAKQLFEKYAIDIMLCDIEMPLGTGFDLMDWLSENKYTPQVIVLTAYDSFSYAKKAIHFQCLEYLLKPVSSEELIAALEKALVQCEIVKAEALHKKEELAYKDEKFLLNVVKNAYEPDQQFICQKALDEGVSVNVNQKFLPVLFTVKRWAEDVRKGTGNFIDGLKDSLKTYIPDLDWVIPLNYTMILGLVDFEQKRYEKIALTFACQRCIENIQSQLKSGLSIYIGEPCYLWEMAEMKQKLMIYEEQNVLVNHVHTLSNEMIARTFEMPEMESWNYMLSKGDQKALESSIDHVLSRLKQEANLNTKTLFTIQQNFLQCVYAYMDSKKVKASHLFDGDAFIKMEKDALKNDVDFMGFVTFVLGQLFRVTNIEDYKHTVDVVCKYIEAHLDEKLSCNGLAQMCYLNPDYLTRCFKKATGMSLINYITNQRMERAKLILSESETTIIYVARKVGYDSYTHFVKTFEKVVGMTPQEYHTQNYQNKVK